MITSTKKSTLLIFCLILNCSLNVIAMETLTDVDFEVLLASIGSLGLYQKFPTYFANYGPEEKQHCINAHTRIIKAMLDSHSISYPEEMTSDWLESLKTSLMLKQNNYFIDISGLNKIEIAQALFEQARSVEDKFEIPSNPGNIDYIGRRAIKADLSQNTFDSRLYNKENGEGAAQRAIAKLRAKRSDHSSNALNSQDDDQESE